MDTAFHDARFDLEDCEIEAATLKPLVDAPGVDIRLRGYLCVIEEVIRAFEFRGKSTSRQFSQRPREINTSTNVATLEKRLIALVDKILMSFFSFS